MNNKDEEYKSIPFTTYFSERNGKEVFIDNTNRIIRIRDGVSNLVGVVYFSDNINHIVHKEDLLGITDQPIEKVYYVYQNGAKGYDWLWHYGDLIQLDELV